MGVGVTHIEGKMCIKKIAKTWDFVEKSDSELRLFQIIWTVIQHASCRELWIGPTEPTSYQ